MSPTTKKYQRLILIGGVLALFVVVYGGYLISGLPSLEQLENPKPELSTKVYSIDGVVLDQFYIKNRTQISLDQLPPKLVDALIATEDKNFYNHWGVDMPRFLRAMIKNMFLLRLREGASTITQQLARNLYDLKNPNETVFGKATRKIREFITAIQIERNYTKTEILEMYLSVAYFGRSAYGIASAAQIYFGKSTNDLNLGEGALLIGMLKGPGTFDPFRHKERSFNRRSTVLDQMVKYDYLSETEAKKIKDTPPKLIPVEEHLVTGIAPHFVEWIRQQLDKKAEKYGFDIYRDGLSVYTTLDSRMQRKANVAVEDHLKGYQSSFNKAWDWKKRKDELKVAIALAIQTSDVYRSTPSSKRDSVFRALSSNEDYIDSVKKEATRIEVGFVVLDHGSGGIRAMVGGSNFKSFKYGLNHVTQIRRQPGSAFKPFVYTVAIDNGYPPCFELLNQPVTLVMADGKRWAPENFDHTFGGKNTLREGLTYSINLIAIRAIMEIAPVKQVIEYAHRMGIRSDLPPYESLAIGTGEVQPLEITAAYGVYPNEGVYVEPISILRIEDKNGNLIEENHPSRREVLSKETAYIMTDMLKDNVNKGTGARVRSSNFWGPAAGKTGTTQDYGDAWFVGYTPQLTAGVWVGFDNKSVHFTTDDGQGGRAAAPIWGNFMKTVYDDKSIGLPMTDFIQPEGVQRDSVCVETRRIATMYCPERVDEVFNRNYMPGTCPLHTSWNWNDSDQNKKTINF